ncbi:hypothetical protein BT96DRAFT_150224 [Gymnopus androsaceus JB14]|uniref:Uncharacterized protein n=1 Tax=Gymnopus androsaceus JB14 TaxID=1447944 RepID=A0A6A4IBP4_9AGAR|nr:hypothetical protein BT96DRAFT_150224 [Gymnopus androsaceus JB14]
MSQYLSQTRIEEPVLLEPTDISFLRERIFETETQVENLEAQISELTRQRDSKLVELALFRNILSPVRRIPAEILSELFELACLPRDGIFHSKHTLVSYTYNLSSVCAAWRQIAHTIPRLWSKLCFDYGRHRKASMTDIECVGEWVNRSRGLPLDVYLSLSLKSDSTQFLEKILDFRHRIRTLNVAGYAGIIPCALPSTALFVSSVRRSHSFDQGRF